MSVNTMKYGRSLHAHISKGTTSDDRFMPSGYVEAFAKLKGLVMTEKLDGQNDSFKKDGLYARSHAAPSSLPWDKPMRERWSLIKDDLGDLEIFGENMFGVHSIGYKKLESFFYVFAVREGDLWLSWDDVKLVAGMFDFPTVPEIEIKISLNSLLGFSSDENVVLDKWFTENLGMSWIDFTNTGGALGGYDPITGEPASEGIVTRSKDSFKINNGLLPVYPNEFDSIFKLVREGHVKTDEHWTQNWSEAQLIDYIKYGWHGYEYLSKKQS